MGDESGVKPAYLLVDGVTVYELAPNSTVTIGRLDNNQVVLDDYKVSREHALLKFSGDAAHLVDLASTHGTIVNGDRITHHLLQFGESFHIVSHELTFLKEQPEVDAAGDAAPVTTVQASATRSLDRRVKFFGGLNEFSLLTLVQFLYQEKQSGLLMLEMGSKPGPRIYFQNGEIIHVLDETDLGELLTKQMHDQSLFFYFHHETEFPVRTVMESTPNFLMELCHSVDMRASPGQVNEGVSKETIQLPQPSKK
jgi:pSer/pThr/pTyr-binding forkhead associated (FHA) protein